MKSVVAISFAVVFLLLSLKDLATYVNFKFQQKRISEVLCDNRDKPKMYCNGKCQLKKQIQFNHEHPQKAPSPIIEDYKEIIAFKYAITIKPILVRIHQNSTFHYSNPMKLNTFISSIFRPPKF